MTKPTKAQLKMQDEIKESDTWDFEHLVVEIATKKLEIERINKEWKLAEAHLRKRVNVKQLELNKLNRLLKHKKVKLEKRAR